MPKLIIKCPKCAQDKFWKIRDRRLKCSRCRYIFTLQKSIIVISRRTLRKVIQEFILENMSEDTIIENSFLKIKKIAYLS